MQCWESSQPYITDILCYCFCVCVVCFAMLILSQTAFFNVSACALSALAGDCFRIR